MCYSDRCWFWGTFHKIDVFVFFWAKHNPQLKLFYRDMVYLILIHLLNQVTLDMIPVYLFRQAYVMVLLFHVASVKLRLR